MSLDAINALLNDPNATDDTLIYECGHGKISIGDLRNMKAQIAAAYEGASNAEMLRKVVEEQSCGEWTDQMIDEDTMKFVSAIRSQAPADAQAMLEKVKGNAVQSVLSKVRTGVAAQRRGDTFLLEQAHNNALKLADTVILDALDGKL